jgi:hypothetical protein
MTRAIIILREPTSVEVENILRKASDNLADIYFLPEFAKYFKEMGTVIKLDDEKKKQINYSTLNQLLAFGDKKINGRAVSEHLAFSKYASIWYYHKFRVYFLMKNRQYDLALLKPLLETFDEIEVYTNNQLGVYVNDHIKLYYFPLRIGMDYFSMFHYGVFLLLRVFLGFFRSSGRKQKYLILDKSNLQHVLMPDLSMRFGNYILEYVFNKINKDFLIIHEVELPKFQNGNDFRISAHHFKNRNPNSHFQFGEFILFRGFLSRSVRKITKKITRSLADKYDELLSFVDEPFEIDIISEYKNLHNTSTYFVFKYLSYDRFFKRSTFMSATSIDENSPSVKTILDAAKSHNVVTIGIQHGNISDLSPAYMYTSDDLNRSVMVEKTLVWGEYWKNFLTEKAHFPVLGLYITGQLRTDIIPVLLGSKDSLFKGSNKNIVFASQPIPDPDLRYRAAYDVFQAARLLGEDYFFWLKLHPAELNDSDYYRSIADKAGCKNFEILINADLYEVIASCDVLITCYSTVGTEAVYFNKPLIILDHLKQDLINYHRLGVAFQVVNSDELYETIKLITQGEKKINQIAYNNFIKDYAFQIDGNAVSRTLAIIKG